MAAIFRRKLTTSHAVLGSDIKDSPVSPLYTDVFDGNTSIFSGIENLNTGQIPMGDFSNSVDYLLEFPTLEAPKFGEAQLHGLELSLYFSDLDYKRDYYTSRFKIFKSKKSIGSNTSGVFGTLQTSGGSPDVYDDIFFASATASRQVYEVETFDQIPSVGVPNLTNTGAYYINAEVAYSELSFLDSLLFYDEEDFMNKYAETYKDEQVIFVELDMSKVKMIATLIVTMGQGDPISKVRPTTKHSGFDPSWKISDLGTNLRMTGELIDISQTVKNKVSVENSFFDEVRYTGPHITGRTDSGDDEVLAFSYPFVEPGLTGGALSMSAVWDSALTTANGSPLAFGTTTQNFQSIMLMKRLPHPTEKIREKGSGGSTIKKEGLEIDIKFNVENLPTIERLSDTTTGVKATRGFFITLSTRPPAQTENFNQYLYNLENQASTFDEISTTHPKNSATSSSNTWVFGCVAYSDVAPVGDNPANATPCIITGGKEDTNENYIKANGNQDSSLPYIYSLTGSQTNPLNNNPSNSIKRGIFLGEWFNLKIIISPNYSRIGYIITDEKNKILWSRKDERMDVIGTNTLTANLNQDGFPSYMCFWLNNRKIGFDATNESAKGYYNSTGVDAVAKVLIDTISISNVTCDINNATSGNFNKYSKKPVVIDSVSSVIPIEADDLNTSTVDTTSGGSNFGSLSGLFLENIYDAFGIQHGSQTAAVGVVPSYLILGTKTASALEGQATNLFLGGFNTENADLSDYADATKHMGITTSISSSEVVAYASEDGPALGQWVDNIESNYINDNVSPNFKFRTSYTNAEMEVRYFTRKGFVRFEGGGIGSGLTFTKRECPFLAAKIVSVENAAGGEIMVNDPSGLLGKGNEEYIIYRIGKSWVSSNSTTYKTGIRLKKDPEGSNIFKFRDNILVADDGSTKLCVDKYLDELYISPYRFWLIMEMYNVSSSGNEILPAFQYKYALLLNNSTAPSSTTKGLTYSEFLYSDAPYNKNAWSLNISKNSIIETEIDYGFGNIDDDGEGYMSSEQVTVDSDFTLFDVSGLVDQEGERLAAPGEKITFFTTKDISSRGSVKLSTTKVSSSAQKPFLTYIYKDELPSIEDFKVQPNEDDPFYPQYTWSSKDDDLWYGFLILDELSIEHQYHSAVAHIPLSEKNAIADGSKTYLYRYDGAYNGTGVGGSGTGLTNTLEGLAGYALDFDGSTERYAYWGDGTYTDPTSNASFVAHVVVDNANATHYIVSKKKQFEIYIDSGGKINAKLYYSSTASVNLQSFSVVPEDGETPTNIIVTFDASLAVGNCRLFINGKLEDQSGIKTTDGSTHNWKTGATLNETGTEKLIIGMQNDSGTDYTNHFNGHIEEVVIYNKTIYPVVPQTGELTIYKQPWELTVGDIAAGKSIVGKLFIKDYHNIRGTTTNEVASTSMVAYRKSGVGLKTN